MKAWMPLLGDVIALVRRCELSLAEDVVEERRRRGRVGSCGSAAAR